MNYAVKSMPTIPNETNQHTWCVNAMHGMSANNDGTTKMCCMVNKSYVEFVGADPNLVLGVSTIRDNFNNLMAQAIRWDLNNGQQHPACEFCWQEEHAGRMSKRMRDNQRYLHEIQYHNFKPYEGLAKFELNLGNHCNISCRTCSAAISSGWLRETYDVAHASSMSFKAYAQSMRKYHQQYDEDSDFWPDLVKNLGTIRQFDFYGGEPFLSRKMWEILRICVDQGHAAHMELHYNTNGTVWPPEIEQLWPHFAKVYLSFSVDGIGSSFEYMRYPATWPQVLGNMAAAQQYAAAHNNISISWCVTISNLNVHAVPDVVDYHQEHYSDFGIYLNLVHGPKHYNISHMPAEAKSHAADCLNILATRHAQLAQHIQGVVQFMLNGAYDAASWQTFWQVVHKHDAYRQQNFAVIFPEWHTILCRTTLT